MKRLKFLIVLTVLTVAIFSNWSCNRVEEQFHQQDCFSIGNFEKVLTYIDQQITSNNTTFLTFEGYELHLNNPVKKISLKKKNYTHSVINEKGIYSLNKSAQGNKKSVKEANRMFCILLKKLEK